MNDTVLRWKVDTVFYFIVTLKYIPVMDSLSQVMLFVVVDHL